jgi:hypothetical protein
MAPFKVFTGGYVKEGATSEQLYADRNYCSEESIKFKMNTAATGDVSRLYMLRFMLRCMKEKGYEPVDIRPEELEDPFQVGRK